MTSPPILQPHERIDLALRFLASRDASSLILWRTLFAGLGEIIGAGGVESLFHRSLARVSVQFPWLDVPARGAGPALELLSSAFATQTSADAEQASAALLKQFVNTLIVLIGALVTDRILLSAWDAIVVNDGPE